MSATITQVVQGALVGSGIGAALGFVSSLFRARHVPLEVTFTHPVSNKVHLFKTLGMEGDVPVCMLISRLRESIAVDPTVCRDASTQLNIVVYQLQRFFARLSTYRHKTTVPRYKIQLRHQALRLLKSIAALETLVIGSRECDIIYRALGDVRDLVTAATLDSEK
jgi:hypothetical protein